MPPLTKEQRMYAVNSTLEPKGYEQVTDLSSATNLSPAQNARVALVQALDQDVRWRDDGTDPTASVGMLLAAGKDLLYVGNLAKVKFIETSASAELNVAYYQ